MIRIPTHEPLLEAALQRLVIARLNLLPGVDVWRSNAGGAKDGATGRVLKFGVPGQADVTGLMRPHGRRLEVELKSKRGYQTPEQRAWQIRIEKLGGLYVLARTLSEALVPVCEALGLPYVIEGA